ncbi:MAG: T9SS type A sorting domain-containing protein, partial [Flavobacteriales bacterium]|nr:T9SS type A sorting domain-containing protein [Flavobacteriales bacterium]
GVCTWDFGDGSPTVTTVQGANTICHQFPSSGTYTVSLVYNATNCYPGAICYGNSQVTIPQLNISSIESDYNGFNVSCEGANDGWISMSSANNYSYEWPVSSTTPWSTPQYGPNVNGLTAGSYTVLATGSNGCTGNMVIILDEPSLGGLVSVIDASCYGSADGEIDFTPLDGFPPFQYSWSNGDIVEDPNSLGSGMHYLLLTDSFGCTETFQYEVFEPSPLISSTLASNYFGYNVSCIGSQDGFIDLSVSGSVPVYSYQWSNGDTIEDINGLSAGTYSYVVTDQNGCITSDTIEIIEPTINIQESAVDVSCFGATNGSVSVNVSGSTAPYYVFWDNNINTSLVPSGTYVYQIIDSIGCVYFDSLIVSEPDSFIVTESVVDVSCNGFNDGSISLVISGATPPFVVNWFGANIVNAQVGTYNYTIVDSNNCYFSEIAIVNEPNQVDVLNQVVDPSCGNTNDGSVSLQISGGSSPYSVDWGGSNPNSLGIGSYVFVVTDDNNCVDSNTVTLTSVSNIQVVSEITQISCNSFCDGSIDLTITGGVSPYAVDWFGVNPAFLCEGSVSYEIVDAVGCYYAENFQIISPDSVELSISQLGMQLEANASGGVAPYSYEWFNDFGSLVNSQTVNITSNGSYYCIAIDVNHCQSDTVEYYYSETSIEDLGVTNLNIYPNPTDNILNIEFESVIENDFSLYFIDVLGQKIMIDRIEKFKGNYTYKLDLQRFSQGIYIFELRSGSEIYNKKVIKK